MSTAEAGTAPPVRELAARSIAHPLSRALLALTFTTGLIDAVSYLGLGRVFTANMTGNVVLLGFGIAGTGGLPVVAPLVSLAAFLGGAVAGGRVARLPGAAHPAGLLRSTVLESLLLVVSVVVAAAVHVRAGALSGDVVIAILAFAMGVRNAVVRRIGVPDLTTTVLTMTLTGLAADSAAAGGDGRGTPRRAAAAMAMLVGALVGALLVKSSLVAALALAAGLALLTSLLYRSTRP